MNKPEKLTFKASAGWLENFLRRHNLVLRRITSSGRDLPTNCGVVIAAFFRSNIEIFRAAKFNRDLLMNMDETSVYVDFPPDCTYEEKGTKRVKAVTSGSERTRLSAAFTATASGTKLPIMILVPRKTCLPDYTPPDNVRLVYKTGATFDQNVICDFLTTVVGEHMVQNNNIGEKIIIQ